VEGVVLVVLGTMVLLLTPDKAAMGVSEFLPALQEPLLVVLVAAQVWVAQQALEPQLMVEVQTLTELQIQGVVDREQQIVLVLQTVLLAVPGWSLSKCQVRLPQPFLVA
jgi:hypothetical protein